MTYQPDKKAMAIPAGLEPATIRLEGECSIRLSYGTVMRFARRFARDGSYATSL